MNGSRLSGPGLGELTRIGTGLGRSPSILRHRRRATAVDASGGGHGIAAAGLFAI